MGDDPMSVLWEGRSPSDICSGMGKRHVYMSEAFMYVMPQKCMGNILGHFQHE